MPERLPRAILELRTDDGSTAVFVLDRELEITDTITKQWLVGGRGETVQALLDETGLNEGDRQSFYIDAGLGTYEFLLSASIGPEDVRWGTTADTSVLSMTSASGADARTKRDVFQHVAETGRTGSTAPATLHYSHYHDGTYTDSGEPGLYPPRRIAVRESQFQQTSDDASTLDATITCQTVATLDQSLDALQRAKKGVVG